MSLPQNAPLKISLFFPLSIIARFIQEPSKYLSRNYKQWCVGLAHIVPKSPQKISPLSSALCDAMLVE